MFPLYTILKGKTAHSYSSEAPVSLQPWLGLRDRNLKFQYRKVLGYGIQLGWF